MFMFPFVIFLKILTKTKRKSKSLVTQMNLLPSGTKVEIITVQGERKKYDCKNIGKASWLEIVKECKFFIGLNAQQLMERYRCFKAKEKG